MTIAARQTLRSTLLAIAIGALSALATLMLTSIARAQAPTTSGAKLGSLLDDPVYGWGLRSVIVIAFVVAFTQGVRSRFKTLRDDSDRSAFILIATGVLFGVFLGAIGLAPATPIGGSLAGGLACGLLAIAGVHGVKKALGFREEVQEAKRAATNPEMKPVPPAP